MPPRSAAPTESRDRIVKAALACFTRKGYNNTTMDDIVAESGLSKGTLYWYFDSKDDLFGSALGLVFEDLFNQETLFALEQLTTASDKLCALAIGIVQIGEHKSLFNLLVEFWASSPRREEVGQVWLDLLLQFKGVLVGIIEEGVESGEFKPVDVEELVWAVMAAYDGLAVYILLKPELDLLRISQIFAETLLSGLVVRESNQGGK